MTAEPNSALVRDLHAALERGDREAVRAVLSDDAVWHIAGTHPASGEHRGADAVLRTMAFFDGSVETHLMEVIEGATHSVALLRARGTRNGATYDAVEVDLYRVEDGRIAELWSFSEDQARTDAYWSG